MAYFLGKGIDANLDDLFPMGESKADCLRNCREQMALDPGFDYNACIEGCGGMRVTPGEVTIPETEPFEPIKPPGGSAGETPTTPGTDTNFLDDLIAGMFGKGFETVRGVGGRTRESVFDALARQGLMGTGAAKGVAQDIAWESERGISDLMRQAEMWKYQQEQEAMNQFLQYLFSMMGSWR
jgi:hypothetical protein